MTKLIVDFHKFVKALKISHYVIMVMYLMGGGPGSVVVIATGYGLDGGGLESR